MELKEYEKKIGHSIDEMTYEEMRAFLEYNKERSVEDSLSYGDAYWLKELHQESQISTKQYLEGLSILREAILNSKQFRRIFIEAEDPTGKEKDHWEFYLSD